MFFEQGMRNGVSFINKRYSESSKNEHILYLHMNNLYGHTMSQYLPYTNFKWVKDINKIEQKLMSIKNDRFTEYILEVDLEYPQTLHHIQNYYPLALENLTLDYCSLTQTVYVMNFMKKIYTKKSISTKNYLI